VCTAGPIFLALGLREKPAIAARWGFAGQFYVYRFSEEVLLCYVDQKNVKDDMKFN
jgi:hypothetical protein